ncbi:unnamed protein product [Owenia fusiformis]|uniref:Uncharacterized protein n=1 Tax=Owenia fusiformis TaxID=6347 RepID=A0A8J1TZ67_OWEFU|nr:unnamed protein product [Owenia fusiformis]
MSEMINFTLVLLSFALGCGDKIAYVQSQTGDVMAITKSWWQDTSKYFEVKFLLSPAKPINNWKVFFVFSSPIDGPPVALWNADQVCLRSDKIVLILKQKYGGTCSQSGRTIEQSDCGFQVTYNGYMSIEVGLVGDLDLSTCTYTTIHNLASTTQSTTGQSTDSHSITDRPTIIKLTTDGSPTSTQTISDQPTITQTANDPSTTTQTITDQTTTIQTITDQTITTQTTNDPSTTTQNMPKTTSFNREPFIAIAAPPLSLSFQSENRSQTADKRGSGIPEWEPLTVYRRKDNPEAMNFATDPISVALGGSAILILAGIVGFVIFLDLATACRYVDFHARRKTKRKAKKRCRKNKRIIEPIAEEVVDISEATI